MQNIKPFIMPTDDGSKEMPDSYWEMTAEYESLTARLSAMENGEADDADWEDVEERRNALRGELRERGWL